jgi:hypothetical protein
MHDRAGPAHAEYPSVPKQTTYLVNKIEYDNHGHPLLAHVLGRRPGRKEDRFTIVHAVNTKPVRSYFIAIVEREKADLSKPFVVIYEWTGRGFEGGRELAGNFQFYTNHPLSSRDAAFVGLSLLLAPIVIGGVTGFIVEALSSMPAATPELKRMVVNEREKVIDATGYEYDEKVRIKYLKMYPPAEQAVEMARSEFFYAEGGIDPYKTEVTSEIEKKMRTIQQRSARKLLTSLFAHRSK